VTYVNRLHLDGAYPSTSFAKSVLREARGVTDTYENASLIDLDMKEADIATGARAHGIAFSVDGARIFVSNRRAGTVTVVDVGSAKAVGHVKTEPKPNSLAVRRP
jgi:YVTN family beta-propeller protein